MVLRRAALSGPERAPDGAREGGVCVFSVSPARRKIKYGTVFAGSHDSTVSDTYYV